jgi:hypothetical protein
VWKVAGSGGELLEKNGAGVIDAGGGVLVMTGSFE